MKKIILIVSIFTFSILNSQVKVLKKNLYFGLGKTNLTNVNKRKLDSIVNIMKSSQTYSAEIRGYTCNIGSLSVNTAISKLRALSVYNYLIDKGIEKKYITYQGLATANPIGSNDYESGRKLNRRAEIEVLFKLMDEGTQNPDNQTATNSSGTFNTNSNVNNSSNTTNSSMVQPETPKAQLVEMGPEMVQGEFSNKGTKIIKSTNGIIIEIPDNCFSTSSNDNFEFDFKDYTQNYDIIKKNIPTKSGKDNLMLLGAFSINFSQGNEDITMNVNNPVKVYIPDEFDPEIKLYTNHRNWTPDTINKMSYDNNKKAYVIETKYLGQMFGLLKTMPTTSRNVLVKITGIDNDNVKPYVIYDNNMISSVKHLKGKLYTFSIPSENSSFKLRAMHSDFTSKTPTHFNLSEDISKLEPKSTITKTIDTNKYMRICIPSKFVYKPGQLEKSKVSE